ncbi:DUF2254 domain-containing protein [Streptacidiphilus sp. P02-A3a]|nr:DUF2254 domain-containing protein [Streptacidiphilus sp. P02-A3a]
MAPRTTLHPMIPSGSVLSLLFTIGFGVVGLVSLVYSLLFLVVQWAGTTFTLRLGLFREDPAVWRTFAVSLGVFIYCVTAALTIGTRAQVSLALPVSAILLALLALGFMYSVQTRAFASIQLGPCLDTIATRTRRTIAAVHTRPLPQHAAGTPAAPPSAQGRPVTWPGPAAVLCAIDLPALTRAARAHDCLVVLTRAPGQPLVRNHPVAHIHGGDLPARTLFATLATGVERTFDQDPEFGLRLLADIAMRGLSPAINDPATAAQALDHIEDLLLLLAGQDLDVSRSRDAEGTLRVVLPLPDWTQYVRTALDDVITSALNAPLALERLRQLLRHLRQVCPPPRRAVLEDRLDWVQSTLATGFPHIWASIEAAEAADTGPSS